MSASRLWKTLAVATAVLCPGSALAQTTTASPEAAAPDSLVVYFDSGSSAVRPGDEAVLDQASRLYRDGNRS
jgi:hypothetical protein